MYIKLSSHKQMNIGYELKLCLQSTVDRGQLAAITSL